jgi:hypothetical protein
MLSPGVICPSIEKSPAVRLITELAAIDEEVISTHC